MTKETVLTQEQKDKLRQIFSSYLLSRPGESQIEDGKCIVEEYCADSLDIIEIIMETEEVFGIEIPDEDAEKMIPYNGCTFEQVVENFQKFGYLG